MPRWTLPDTPGDVRVHEKATRCVNAGVARGFGAQQPPFRGEQPARLPMVDYCFTASICTTKRTFLGKPHSTP